MSTPRMDIRRTEILSDLLLRGASERTALVSPRIETPENGPALSYAALREQVAALAATLQGWGVGRGDRVAFALPNGIEVVTLFLATTAAVATAAPLNPAYTRDEFRFYLSDIGARAVIVPASGGEAARKTVPADALLIEATLAPDGNVGLERLGGPPGTAAHDRAAADDTALFLHTSGTTSRPKGVPLSHRNLIVSTANIVETYALAADDVALCVMPLFHIHGLVASTLSTFASGGTVVVPPRFSAGAFWPHVAAYKPTWYSAVPTIHQVLLARADADHAPRNSSLRFIRSSSAALAPATMQGLEDRFGCPVIEAYGMTEAAHQMASNPLPPGERRSGSVGRGSGVRIGIMDEAGALLGPGVQGEVVIQGDNVTRGYHNNPEANAAAFTNGWFRTGDQGVLDREGYLTLVGRLKELINRGGEKISPREVDEALLSHPAVAEAVSFGVPDEKYGEEVAAAVVLKTETSPAALTAHCEGRLASFKVPKTIYVTREIPRTATGKIQRRRVAGAFHAPRSET